ncbi:MAG: DNRLRE domain-containing protein [Chthoniobacterales bacterium]
MKTIKTKFLIQTALVGACALALSTLSVKAATFSSTSVADAFLATGSPGNPLGSNLTANNYGGAGALAVAPSTALKGEFQSLIRFDISGAAATFDGAYGNGNWQITSINLRMASNFGNQGAQPNNSIFNTVNGGAFNIQWLADDSWIEGTGNPSNPQTIGVNYNSLGTLLGGAHETVGAFTYTPPGKNVQVDWNLNLTSAFLADATTLGELSFLLSAPSSGGASMMGNSRSYGTSGNHPFLTVTAIPEPSSAILSLLGLGLCSRILRRRWKYIFLKLRTQILSAGACALVAAVMPHADAATFQNVSVADAFLAAAYPDNNYGGGGSLSVAPPSASKGEFQTLLKFDLSGAAANFDGTYGSGNWQITSIKITLTGNVAIQGESPGNPIFNAVNAGNFNIEWLANDSWIEGSGRPNNPGATGVTYNSLSTLLGQPHESVGSFSYSPPGNNVPETWDMNLTSAFLTDASALGEVTFLLSSADGGGASFGFNSRSYHTAANHPFLTVTAIPEPSSAILGLLGLGMCVRTFRRR